jgi:hypothetical protein
MDIQAAKLDVVQKILSIKKESILIKINTILEKELIVAYTTDGKPLTKAAYNKRLEKAEDDILKGRITSSDDLRKEIKTWKK